MTLGPYPAFTRDNDMKKDVLKICLFYKIVD